MQHNETDRITLLYIVQATIIYMTIDKLILCL